MGTSASTVLEIEAVHAEPTKVLLVAGRVTANPHQGIGDWIPQHPDKLGQLIRCLAQNHPTACVDNRALGRQHHVDGFLDLTGMAANSGVVGPQFDLLGVRILVPLVRSGHILGDIHDYRAGTAGGSNVIGLADDFRDFLGVPDTEVVLHHRSGDTHHISFLERVLTDESGCNLAA